MAITKIHFCSIPVDDQDRALAFYTEKLGFTVHTDAPYGENWRWIFLEIPGADTQLQFSERKDMEIHGKPALCLVCDNVDDECARLDAAGVNITNEPQEAPWAPGTRWATIRDTEENVILLESFKD